jgi:hypothetical protein
VTGSTASITPKAHPRPAAQRLTEQLEAVPRGHHEPLAAAAPLPVLCAAPARPLHRKSQPPGRHADRRDKDLASTHEPARNLMHAFSQPSTRLPGRAAGRQGAYQGRLRLQRALHLLPHPRRARDPGQRRRGRGQDPPRRRPLARIAEAAATTPHGRAALGRRADDPPRARALGRADRQPRHGPRPRHQRPHARLPRPRRPPCCARACATSTSRCTAAAPRSTTSWSAPRPSTPPSPPCTTSAAAASTSTSTASSPATTSPTCAASSTPCSRSPTLTLKFSMVEPKGGGDRLFDHLMPRVADVAAASPTRSPTARPRAGPRRPPLRARRHPAVPRCPAASASSATSRPTATAR